MHLWLAIKYSPIALRRDVHTHTNSWRLDGRWWLPKAFDLEYPIHIEIVLTHACGGQCTFCRNFGPQSRVNGVHIVTYSLDLQNKKVFRTVDRHFASPKVDPANGNEFWSYFCTPIVSASVLKAFDFLQAQVSKPIRKRFLWNFLCLCRQDGAKKGDNFAEASSWHCAELASATLMLFWPEYEQYCLQDPSLVSPCILDLQLRELIPSSPVAQIRILPVMIAR